jgi:hypothetical protein
VRQFFRKPAHWALLFSLTGCASIYLRWWDKYESVVIYDRIGGWEQPEGVISVTLFLFVFIWLLVRPHRGGPVLLSALAILVILGLFALATVGPAAKKAFVYPRSDLQEGLAKSLLNIRPGAYLALVSALGLAIAGALQVLGLPRGRRWAPQGLAPIDAPGRVAPGKRDGVHQSS